MPQQIINRGKNLTEANNNQLIDIYTPSVLEGIPTDAIIYDFFLSFSLQSIDELPPEATISEGGALMSQEEKDRDFIQRTEGQPGKTVAIYYERDGVLFNGIKMVCYRQDPSYQESVMKYLTTQGRLAIQHGTKILAKIEDYNSGLLSANDLVSLWIIGEEIKNLDVSYLANNFLQ